MRSIVECSRDTSESHASATAASSRRPIVTGDADGVEHEQALLALAGAVEQERLAAALELELRLQLGRARHRGTFATVIEPWSMPAATAPMSSRSSRTSPATCAWLSRPLDAETETRLPRTVSSSISIRSISA